MIKTIPGLDVSLYDTDYAQLCGKSIAQRVITYPDQRCQNCGDTGRLFFDVPSSNGGALTEINGKMVRANLLSFPCPLCADPIAEQKAERLRLEKSGLKPSEYHYQIDYIAGKPGKELVYKAAKSILDELLAPKGFYLFYGDYGVGKSGTMMSVVSAACRAGVSAHYTTAENILEEIRSTFGEAVGDSERETERVILERYRHFKILAIDELGADRMSNTQWSLSKMFGVLDERYRERDHLCTLTASNSTPEALQNNPNWKYFENRTRDGMRIPVGGECFRGK